MKVTDIARSVAPNAKHEIVGIRPGEKLHEQMIGPEDAQYTYEYDDYYKILPSIHRWSRDPVRVGDGVKVPEDFTYVSNANSDWMSREALQEWIESNRKMIGKI